MRKIILITAFFLVGMLTTNPAIFAEEVSFFVSAEIPAATTITFIVSRVEDGGEFTVIGEGSMPLDFTTAGAGIIYDSTNNIWVASRYFAIDVSPRDDSGNPAPASFHQIQFTYADDPGVNTGLGAKGVVTVVRVDTVPDPSHPGSNMEQETQIVASTFGNIASESIGNSDISGGFMRTYVGLSTGEPGKPGEPFTNADAPGVYAGTLTLTATLN